MTIQIALRTVSLESRNAVEMARMLERHGCQPISAPSMREVPLQDQAEALAFGEVLMEGGCDALVLLTGVGTRMLVDALAMRFPRDQVLSRLGATRLLCRGPKPVAALKSLGLKPSLVAPSPNTWRELLAELDRTGEALRGRRVWLQEYGRQNAELTAGLAERGATVRSVSIYAWQLPEDLGPLKRAIETLCQREAEAVMFTSARQVDHLLEVAGEMGLTDPLRAALSSAVLVVSVGPVTSEALRGSRIEPDLEPEHPKMGPMVRTLAQRGAELLELKRSRPKLPTQA